MSQSVLNQDERYLTKQDAKGHLNFGDWHVASIERYRAKKYKCGILNEISISRFK